MTNIERKKEKWEIIKKQILSTIPKKYAIDVEGLDDEGVYFHPIIKVEDDIIIRGQADVDDNDNDNRVYAWGVRVEQVVGFFIHVIELNIEDLEQVNRILVNWDSYKDRIKQYIEMKKAINENITMLQEIQSNITNNLLNDTFLKEDRKKCLDKLFSVKEWIENERVIEKYSGVL